MERAESEQPLSLRAIERLKALSKATFLRSVAVLAGGTAIGRALIVLAAPILTRLYTPGDLGRLGVFLAFVGFATTATSLRYEVAIISAKTREEADHLAIASLALITPVSILLSIGLYFMIQVSALGLEVLPSSTAVWGFLVLFLSAAFFVLRYWHLREGHFAVISSTFVLQNGTRAVSQVGLGFLGLGWVGLIAGELLSRIIGISHMAREAWTRIRSRVFPLDLRNLFSVLWAYRKFPLYALPSSLVDSLSTSLVLPLVGQLYGIAAAGYLSLVQMVMAVPLSLIGGSVADAFLNRMSAYMRKEPLRARPFFLQTALWLLGIGILPAIVLIMLAPTLFQWIFGEVWLEAGLMAAVMAPLVLGQLVVSSLSQVVFVFQKQELKLIYDIMRLSVVASVFPFCQARGLSVLQAIQWWSTAEVLLYVLYFFILLRIVSGASRQPLCVE